MMEISFCCYIYLFMGRMSDNSTIIILDIAAKSIMLNEARGGKFFCAKKISIVDRRNGYARFSVRFFLAGDDARSDSLLEFYF